MEGRTITDRRHRELDAFLAALHGVSRRLPAMLVQRAPDERGPLEGARRATQPREAHVEAAAFAAIDRARRLAEGVAGGALYAARLDELELELAMMDALGDPRRVRPIAARRYGRGSGAVVFRGARVSLRSVADDWLAALPPAPEKKTIPTRASSGPTLESLVRRVAAIAGLDIEVRIEPGLVANAAAGDRTVFLADRWFGVREAVRLAVHEVLGHLVAAANGRLQPFALLSIGTAGSFEDQEGLALALEEAAGALDDERMRVLAARVVAADLMHEGAAIAETVRTLRATHGFAAEQASVIAERAYRGGGVARDVVYLRGFLRVREAIARGETTIDRLRLGRVGLDALASLPELEAAGLVRPPVFAPQLGAVLGRALELERLPLQVPSFARSRAATLVGTSPETSPPRRVASLTRFEAT